MHRQLAAELPAADGRRGVVISASKELEAGARAMLLHAEGLFRLDVVVSSDTVRTIVRNFSVGELEFESVPSCDGVSIGFGEIAAYEPGVARLAFSLGRRSDAVRVTATIATLRYARGTVRVTGQAVIRQR